MSKHELKKRKHIDAVSEREMGWSLVYKDDMSVGDHDGDNDGNGRDYSDGNKILGISGEVNQAVSV
jgi:hypothetical protein